MIEFHEPKLLVALLASRQAAIDAMLEHSAEWWDAWRASALLAAAEQAEGVGG